MEMAMELLKVWHESDKPFFTKKDLQDISNQLTGRQERKLRYSCYGQLVSAVEFRRIELAEVFFPLQIEHFMLARTSDAKQPTSPDSPIMMITHRSAVQHSIMITIRNRIEEITNKKIQCYAQDPCYTAVDTWALAQHGCKVLEDPQALLEIDNDCVLFSCCPDLLLKEITVDFARPAILIWDRVVPGKILGRHNPNIDRVRNMIENEYDCYEFWGIHGAGRGPFMANLVVYVRR
ncbi:hypothetical protein N7536_006611 [Penicillium majusculum]|nr:hypothetical protein N7536_006611 [Penicillium majusculum]